MRILYVAIDQTVPGTLGGSVHVQAVAEGLAALGHDVRVLVKQGGEWPAGPVRWQNMEPPFGQAKLRWMRASAVASIAREMRADVVMERYYNFGGEGVMAARRVGVPAVLEVNAPIVDYPGSPKTRLDRALVVEPMRRWRDHICRATDLFITPNAATLPAGIESSRVLEIEWGADTVQFHPGATGPLPFRRDPARILCVFAGAFRAWHGVAHLADALARLHQQGDTRFGAVFIGDGPERARVVAIAGALPGVTFTGAVPHAQLPACLAAADIGVAPFDPSAHGPLSLGFYWSPLKIFEYMAAGLPVVAPALPRLSTLIDHNREGVLYDPADPLAIDAALVSLADASRRTTMGAAGRERAAREYGWDAHCRVLDARLRALVAQLAGDLMATLRVLVVTDAFPPNCGGSGWSAYELTRGIRDRGHHVEIVRVRAGRDRGLIETAYEGLPVTEFRWRAPSIPLVRNIFKNERLWPALRVYLASRIRASGITLVHAHHVMTTVPAIDAAWDTSVRAVATVRDYWPVCYWSDLIYDPSAHDLCPACTPANMARCIKPRGASWLVPPMNRPLINYMRGNLDTKRRALAKADAVIAVSSAIARDLNLRAPELSGAGTRVETIPNPVDMTGLDRVMAETTPPLDGPYVLYAGKLAPNKGVQFLIPALKRAGITWPIVIAGDGPSRETVAADAAASGLDVRLLGWIDRDETLRWMRHATMLAFPSYGPESLSRVLIESAAMGLPIAAMNTGGTRDIITPGVTGLLSSTPEGFAQDLARLAGDEALRARLGAAASRHAREHFASTSVVARVEALYHSLLDDHPA